MTESSTDVVNTTLFTDEQLASITSMRDAAQLLDAAGVTAESIDDYGTGFRVVDAAELVGMEFLILAWRFNPGAYGKSFVSFEAVTVRGDKVIINDGGTGICDQLMEVTRKRTERKHPHPQAGLHVPRGIATSSYWYDPDDPTHKSKTPEQGWAHAATNYLSS